MNEMLRSLGFGQVHANKWTNGLMRIDVNSIDLTMYCAADISVSTYLRHTIKATDLETMKSEVEKFIRMVGKCIQVDEE